MEELFHVPDAEVGHTPGSNLPRRAETFERRDNDGEGGAPISPVREVKFEVFSPETGEAGLASARDGISCRLALDTATTVASTETARTVKFRDGTIVPAIGQGSWHIGQGRHAPDKLTHELSAKQRSLNSRLA